MAFPVIPVALGVPALLRDPLAAPFELVELVTDTVLGFAGLLDPQWGIFQGGSPVVFPDSVTSLEFRNNSRLSDYPLEEGAFESYDKVATPFEVRVRLTSGGDVANRQGLLDTIDEISGDLELYDVVTPEFVYQSVNVTGYSYRRTATNGVGVISIDVTLTQVRVTAEAAFSNTQSPSAAGKVSAGTVQTKTPTLSQLGSLGTFA